MNVKIVNLYQQDTTDGDLYTDSCNKE